MKPHPIPPKPKPALTYTGHTKVMNCILIIAIVAPFVFVMIANSIGKPFNPLGILQISGFLQVMLLAVFHRILWLPAFRIPIQILTLAETVWSIWIDFTQPVAPGQNNLHYFPTAPLIFIVLYFAFDALWMKRFGRHVCIGFNMFSDADNTVLAKEPDAIDWLPNLLILLTAFLLPTFLPFLIHPRG